MSYLVLARKYRPQTLQEVEGQEHITKTLENAIREERIAQSFLFVGSRGVGKTSTARILAKILNCEKRKPKEVTCCNTCPSCVDITAGTSLDVLEIDGASNRGIDEIRNVRENVKFKPSSGQYKVYIIDEVHMLTQEAFNALLKTLEEPPPHVKFIFATTEAHRVLPTIMSRCQRYDFKKIAIADIIALLKTIAKKEKIKCEDTAFFEIARMSDGSLRDAESVFEQLANYGNGEITSAITEEVLGITHEGSFFALAEAILARDAAAALASIHEAVESGKDLRVLAKGLIGFFRDMMIAKTTEKQAHKLIDRIPESIEQLQALAEKFSLKELLYALTILQNMHGTLRNASDPLTHVEVALVKVAQRESLVPFDVLVKKVEELMKTGGARVSNSAQATPVREKQQPLPSPQPQTQARSQSQNPVSPPVQQHASSPQTQSPVPPVVAPPTGAIDFAMIEERWNHVVAGVKRVKMSVGVFLSEAEPVELNAGQLDVGLPAEFAFHKETLDDLANRQLIESQILEVFGSPITIRFVITSREGEEYDIEGQEGSGATPDIAAKAAEMFEGKIIRG